LKPLKISKNKKRLSESILRRRKPKKNAKLTARKAARAEKEQLPEDEQQQDAEMGPGEEEGQCIVWPEYRLFQPYYVIPSFLSNEIM